MKRILAISIAIIMLVPAWSLGAGDPSFEGGADEATAVLMAPGYQATVKFAFPADYYAANATLMVTGLAAEGNGSAYPERVQIDLDNTPIWGFRGSGFGPMGRQDRFSTGLEIVNSTIGEGGGFDTHRIRLPHDAVIKNATMDVRTVFQAQTSLKQVVYFTGYSSDEWFGGWSVNNGVSGAGDVDRDGYDDVIVGAPMNDSAGTDAGSAYIFFGGKDMDSDPDVTFTGAAAGDNFGTSVAGAGDVNGDGYDDVLIGANMIDSVRGYVYLYFGGQNMDANADLVFVGPVQGGNFGLSMSSAGDVNNDSYDDVIIASYWCGPGGRADIFLGGQNMDNTSDIKFLGASGSGFGSGVSGAGDVNGDGYDDVIVGAFDAGANGDGEAYIYLGGQNMDNTTDVTFVGVAPDYEFGLTVTGGGDVNGDGFDDVLIGDKDNRAGGQSTGRAYLYYGGQNMNSKEDLVFWAEKVGDNFGIGATNSADVNNDGYDDVMIGAWWNDDPGTDGGKAYLYLGASVMDNKTDATIAGEAAYDAFGMTVSNAGDVNNDTFDELIVSAPQNGAGGDWAGRAYVYSANGSIKPGMLDPKLGIGTKTIWNASGYLNGTSSVPDFSKVLNDYLRSADISGADNYCNSYIDIPVNITAKTGGVISLLNLSIIYNYNATVPDFASPLNNYLWNLQNQKKSSGNLLVPIRVSSSSTGRVKLTGLQISQDRAPGLVKGIGTVFLDEESWNVSFIDLHQHFEDDVNNDSNLNFSVVSWTNESHVRLWITVNRYLSVDATPKNEADENWTGTVEALVACEDRWGQRTESDNFTIIVQNVNDRPFITSLPATSAKSGQPYSYQVMAVDGDGDSLTYSLPQAPANMGIDDSTGLVSWTPLKGGTYCVTVAAGDGKASDEQSYNVTVASGPNHPPEIKATVVPEAVAGTPYTYTIKATDSDGDSLTFVLKTQIEKMTLDPSTGVLAWTPPKPGDYPVSVEISDGKDSIVFNFTIHVIQANRAPRFQSTPSRDAYVGIPYSYEAKATDEDNDTLAFNLASGPPGMTVDGSSGRLNWVPNATGLFPVKLKVSDGRGGEALQEFVIAVNNRVKLFVEIKTPAEAQKVKGKLAITGKVTNGTLNIVGVQIRLDSGDWIDVSGNSTWTYTLDTTKLKNGKHTLQARAYDGMDYSDIVNRTITVDNQKEAAKGFIPGFVGTIGLAAAAFGLVMRRRRMTSRCR